MVGGRWPSFAGRFNDMTEGHAFNQSFFLPVPTIPLWRVAGRVEEIRREAGVLPRDFAGGRTAVRVRGGGVGKVPGVDAPAGEIHGLPGGFLLPDVQPL